MSDGPSLATLREMMSHQDVRRLYAKVLAPNDNSKNQPYFGGDFSVLNILPAGTAQSSKSKSKDASIFKARLDFAWLSDDGSVHPAPHAQLILYPQYPEVRFSGYLRGCARAPSDLMGSTREPGRLLLLGVRDDGRIIGYAAGPESLVTREFAALRDLQQFGVFVQVPLAERAGADDDRAVLLSELCRIHSAGWIDSKRLNADGTLNVCLAPNCGGYTLEAELGISPNGYAEPDFRGWEVKQHGVTDFKNARGGPITLMTPEPSAGFYVKEGVVAFVEKYGYWDKRGREDRMNFGGTHRAASLCAATGLTLTLVGYDSASGKIIDTSAGISLIDAEGNQAATWLYTDLMSHWNRKHALAAYVPSLTRDAPTRQYQYADTVRLGTGTDFLRFLAAVASGGIYYDPGIKVEHYSTKPTTKRRSQFRIKSSDIGLLYHRLETVKVCKRH
jgi:hypothetical protein